MKYPYVPKSTLHMEPGQFWSIPLSDGKYACGVVVAKLSDLHNNDKISSRSFLGALIDWSGCKPPTTEEIKYKKIIKLGEAHLKSIITTGGCILGKSSFNNLGENPRVKTDDIVTMGYGVLKKVAEKYFA